MARQAYGVLQKKKQKKLLFLSRFLLMITVWLYTEFECIFYDY